MVREARHVGDGERWCSDCQTAKPLSEFPRNRSDSIGYASYCKPCHNKRGRENRIKHHGSTRDYHLRRRYGIDSADFDRMLAAQGGVCAACRKAEPRHVDHDHATGAVRGLLCFNCNQALGNVRDDVYVMRGLMAYLDAQRSATGRPPREDHDLRPLNVVYAGRRRPRP
ncbi:MAG TPA: endonuclease VII domain-containing protein [Mycobacteriales bacterium]|nr:endonuclease VII domain-containing protein [Mycobacteriales bacterium]